MIFSSKEVVEQFFLVVEMASVLWGPFFAR
jgi:hypothetical protein